MNQPPHNDPGDGHGAREGPHDSQGLRDARSDAASVRRSQRRRRDAVAAADACCEVRSAQATSARASRVLAIDCAACAYMKANSGKRSHRLAHACLRKKKNLPKGDVGRCVLTGKNKWSFVADVVFMKKEAVPKALDRPDKRGDSLLRQISVHFQKHHVYKTTNAKGDTVYYAHKGSL